jgi:hypothetical protein
MDQDGSYVKIVLSDCSGSKMHITINFRRDFLQAKRYLRSTGAARHDSMGTSSSFKLRVGMRRRFGQGVWGREAANGAISRNSRVVLRASKPHMNEKFEVMYSINW